MAYATETRTAAFGLTAVVGNITAQVSEFFAKRKVYANTINELEALNDRELADLGIARSMIKRVAIEAAYGA